MQLLELAPAIHSIVAKAGLIAHKSFHLGLRTTSDVWFKDGGSPVTAADIATNDFLSNHLTALLPEAAWLSEETTDNAERLSQHLVWVVDPIDGTRAFLSGHPDWCVSVALVVDGKPMIGDIAAPALSLHYQACRGKGAWCNGYAIKASEQVTVVGARVAGPKSMIAMLDRQNQTLPLERVPSLALRLARVAAGKIDIGLVSVNSHDWDIAAADIILEEAGGILSSLTGELVRYNNATPTHGELVASSRLLHPSVVEALANSLSHWRGHH